MKYSNTIRSNPPVHLKVTEGAKYIGVSERTFRTWISERKVPFVKIGSRIIIRRIDLDRWIEKYVNDVI